MSNRVINILVPIISIIIGLIVGAIVMVVSGYDPIQGYSALWTGIFGDSYSIGNTIRQITPYILAGLAVAFAFRTGLFNIGVEGQLILGWLAAAWVGYAFELPKIIHLPLALLAAAAAGAFWAFIAGFLKAKFKVHEVIATIMLNYTALYIANAVIKKLSDGSFKTERVLESASLRSPFLRELTDNSSLHYGILIALLMVMVMWFILEKTTRGYELKAVGFNQHAAEYAGMSVNKNVILAMTISGMFAGLGGAMEALGTFQNASIKAGFTGIGFDGIAVALLGANTPLGVVFGASLFGSLKYGALNMPNAAGIPEEIVSIIIALIIFFVASGYVIRVGLQKLSKKKEGQ
ncbi:ABC transporter permease [Lysinibacillus sphaericus]|uniref:ABC transporter permease n=3 Tax=Lysinibacillus TaxID=400634 RepID=A0A2S0K3R2_LYSSH|nr:MULTISPECIES: ABC transporter permease [Lysinibacillus]AHN20981.1 branched-chain amino acid ABC transporter permease [Lysinibacillus varians]AVK97949.1 ABC transporter permease [Lysinibacillus sphaericus]MCS1380904.1 ABC transporter permease [Lysinibacillus sphaericus]MED4543449.1 ABC transporter permease [Lysinibacillus sphaericus]TKI18944.1 ABC transporter permease [Lysinibacillus sphaericus]